MPTDYLNDEYLYGDVSVHTWFLKSENRHTPNKLYQNAFMNKTMTLKHLWGTGIYRCYASISTESSSEIECTSGANSSPKRIMSSACAYMIAGSERRESHHYDLGVTRWRAIKSVPKMVVTTKHPALVYREIDPQAFESPAPSSVEMDGIETLGGGFFLSCLDFDMRMNGTLHDQTRLTHEVFR